jgi:hypothetical protein
VYSLIFYRFNFPCIWWLDYWSLALRTIKATPKGRRYQYLSNMTSWQQALPTTSVKVIGLIPKNI